MFANVSFSDIIFTLIFWFVAIIIVLLSKTIINLLFNKWKEKRISAQIQRVAIFQREHYSPGGVEMTLKYLRKGQMTSAEVKSKITFLRGYAGGYLPKEKRQDEESALKEIGTSSEELERFKIIAEKYDEKLKVINQRQNRVLKVFLSFWYKYSSLPEVFKTVLKFLVAVLLSVSFWKIIVFSFGNFSDLFEYNVKIFFALIIMDIEDWIEKKLIDLTKVIESMSASFER